MKLKKYHILLINDFSDSFGGAEKSISDTISLLKEEGAFVHFLSSSKISNEWFLGGRFFNIKFLCITLWLIIKNPINLVWVHNCSRKISASPLLISFLAGKKIIMTLHDFHFFCPKTYGLFEDDRECELGFNKFCFLYKCKSNYTGFFSVPIHFLKWCKVGFHRLIIIQTVNMFLCPSKKLMEIMPKSFHLGPDKFFYMPNFVKNLNIKPNVKLHKSRKFIFVGRISPEKGLEVLLNAVERLISVKSMHDFSVDIVGDGPDRIKIEKMIQEKKLYHHVFLHGDLPHSTVLERYRHYLALIVPSVWMENNPLVILESMACGLPVLASRVGGVPDLITDGINGYLFGMGNYFQLSELMFKIYTEENLAERLGEEAKIFFNKNFHERKFLERLQSVLNQKTML